MKTIKKLKKSTYFPPSPPTPPQKKSNQHSRNKECACSILTLCSMQRAPDLFYSSLALVQSRVKGNSACHNLLTRSQPGDLPTFPLVPTALEARHKMHTLSLGFWQLPGKQHSSSAEPDPELEIKLPKSNTLDVSKTKFDLIPSDHISSNNIQMWKIHLLIQLQPVINQLWINYWVKGRYQVFYTTLLTEIWTHRYMQNLTSTK